MGKLGVILQFVAIGAACGASSRREIAREETPAGGKLFSLERDQAQITSPRSLFEALARINWNHGRKLPAGPESAVRYVDNEKAEANHQQQGKGRASVRLSHSDPRGFGIHAMVGKHNMSLTVYSSFSDLWVISNLLPASSLKTRPANRIYDTTSNGPQMGGYTWDLEYFRSVSARGQVFVDEVSIGGLTVPQQAVQAAAKASEGITDDLSRDGALGLGFSGINTVKPAHQKTWFDNIRTSLDQPVWSSAIPLRGLKTLDFGFIDYSKIDGDIHWVPVRAAEGDWDIQVSGITIKGKSKMGIISASVEFNRWKSYLPRAFVDFYYSHVQGSFFSGVAGSWQIPCTAKLPDITFHMTGTNYTVPGKHFSAQEMDEKGFLCMGPIQWAGDNSKNILGTPFNKNMYVVHEHSKGALPRLGIADLRLQ